MKLTGQIKNSNVVTVTPAPDNSQPAQNTETVENVDVTQDNGTAANTFDSHMYVLFMVLFILSGSVLAVGAVKNKKLRKVLSVFFCFSWYSQCWIISGKRQSIHRCRIHDES